MVDYLAVFWYIGSRCLGVEHFTLWEGVMNLDLDLELLDLTYKEMHLSALAILMGTSLVDSIFVWGRAAGEWESNQPHSVLRYTAAIHHLTGAPIYIPGYYGRDVGQGETGYPGPETWADRLEHFGVQSGFIHKVEGGGHNTKTECEDFLKMADLLGLQCTAAVTTCIHAPRAMLGAVRSMDQMGLASLIMLPVWPGEVCLDREVYGSQGEGPFLLRDWIPREFGRIPTYTAQGDLATFPRLSEYLNGSGEKFDDLTSHAFPFESVIECLRPWTSASEA